MSDQEPIVPVWATPAPAPVAVKRSRWKLGVVAAVSAVIVVGGGVAVANAATTSVKQQGPGYGHPSGAPGGGFGYGGPGGGPGGGKPGRAGGELSHVLHGDFVVKDGNGNYVTERVQSGEVTAVSSTSITVKSADGHSTTFTVNGDTKVMGGAIGDVKTGDQATVVGVVSGDTATAKTITDQKLRPTAKPSGSPKPTRTA